MRVHLIAIGGAGMSVVAELLLAQGHQVQGSDAVDSATLRRLSELGARTWVGHDAAHLAGATHVVVSTAIRADNVELVAAREKGLPVLHRSEALALAAQGRTFVAVAGAHGKTTTSAMIATALTELGLDPGYAIGAGVVGLGSGARVGRGEVFVAEADESDRSFLNYTPAVALVTNIEPDHLDHYGSPEAVTQAFVDFAARVTGTLVACQDDAGSRALAQSLRVGTPATAVLTYGRDPAADVRISEQKLGATGASARILGALGEAELSLAIPGAHVLLNAVGAWCVLRRLGVEAAPAARALGAFRGTERRFQLRGAAAGVRVIDDYAHHPTEVAALLATARAAAGSGRVHVLFQPHLYSRTEAFAAEFAAALEAADTVTLSAIYRSREAERSDITSELITSRLPGARYVPELADAARAVAALAQPGDLVLTVGAGDVTTAGDLVLRALAERES